VLDHRLLVRLMEETRQPDAALAAGRVDP